MVSENIPYKGGLANDDMSVATGTTLEHGGRDPSLFDAQGNILPVEGEAGAVVGDDLGIREGGFYGQEPTTATDIPLKEGAWQGGKTST